MKRYVKKKDFCNIVMSFEDTEILKINQNQKSGKTPFIIYANLESLIENIDGYKNNPEKLSTRLSFSVSTILSFKHRKQVCMQR